MGNNPSTNSEPHKGLATKSSSRNALKKSQIKPKKNGIFSSVVDDDSILGTKSTSFESAETMLEHQYRGILQQEIQKCGTFSSTFLSKLQAIEQVIVKEMTLFPDAKKMYLDKLATIVELVCSLSTFERIKNTYMNPDFQITKDLSLTIDNLESLIPPNSPYLDRNNYSFIESDSGDSVDQIFPESLLGTEFDMSRVKYIYLSFIERHVLNVFDIDQMLASTDSNTPMAKSVTPDLFDEDTKPVIFPLPASFNLMRLLQPSLKNKLFRYPILLSPKTGDDSVSFKVAEHDFPIQMHTAIVVGCWLLYCNEFGLVIPKKLSPQQIAFLTSQKCHQMRMKANKQALSVDNICHFVAKWNSSKVYDKNSTCQTWCDEFLVEFSAQQTSSFPSGVLQSHLNKTLRKKGFFRGNLPIRDMTFLTECSHIYENKELVMFEKHRVLDQFVHMCKEHDHGGEDKSFPDLYPVEYAILRAIDAAFWFRHMSQPAVDKFKAAQSMHEGFTMNACEFGNPMSLLTKKGSFRAHSSRSIEDYYDEK